MRNPLDLINNLDFKKQKLTVSTRLFSQSVLKMPSINVKNFSLQHSLECGQFFTFSKNTIGWYYVITHGRVFKAKQSSPDALEFEGADKDFVVNFFRLDDDLPAIVKDISKDELMRKATTRYPGLRLLRQDLWECLLGFMCSTRNNIPSIKASLKQVSAEHGARVEFDGQAFFLLPTPAQLEKATLKSLMDAKLAFRAKYILETAKRIASKQYDLDALRPLPYMEARTLLQDLNGVGEKVADCVSLYALQHLHSFPVDVWIEKVMNLTYFDGKETSSKQVHAFADAYFGKNARYAQQYIYHYSRSNPKELGLENGRQHVTNATALAV